MTRNKGNKWRNPRNDGSRAIPTNTGEIGGNTSGRGSFDDDAEADDGFAGGLACMGD